MHIVLLPHTELSEIQLLFRKEFPFLKLEFFKKPHGKSESSSRSEMISQNKTIEALTGKRSGWTLNIDPEMSVGQLEKNFLDTLGLSVQVFRKSGNVWLQTTRTDDWTLREQNDRGEDVARSLKKQLPNTEV